MVWCGAALAAAIEIIITYTYYSSVSWPRGGRIYCRAQGRIYLYYGKGKKR